MAQRNPMNERYLGDGPSGQTRKSAASAKPKSTAASSVYIKKKPQTAAEKRAAAKAREKEERAKAAEKARKAAEKAKLAAEANGEADTGEASKAEQSKNMSNRPAAPNSAMPATEEYRKWRKRYWILVIIGIVCIAITFLFTMNPSMADPTLSMVVLGIAYPAILGALFIDFRKVKPLVRAHQNSNAANKSPKQLKHEQEAREQAAAMEAARKAAKTAKRSPRRKKDETIVPGEIPESKQDNATIVPGEK